MARRASYLISLFIKGSNTCLHLTWGIEPVLKVIGIPKASSDLEVVTETAPKQVKPSVGSDMKSYK